MNDFIDEEKEKLLLLHKYICIEGYALHYEHSPTEMIIVSKSEIIACMHHGFKKYFFQDGDEYGYEIEDAFDSLIDSIYDSTDIDNDEDMKTFLKKELKDNRCYCSGD